MGRGNTGRISGTPADRGKRLNASVRFDVGGFGIGSRIAVDSEPFLKHKLNRRLTGTMGWKFFYQDYVDNGQAFGYDVLTQGPVFGVAIHW